MVRKIDWDNQIGRRLKLRDLHVFLTVAKAGSMAKAAARMGVSQPAVSEVIANLEAALGVKLFDRSARGVETTLYGAALLKRIVAAFDELRQSIRDLESISNPDTGEVWIGCPLPITSVILAPVIQRFVKEFPGVVVHVADLPSPALELSGLRERKHDLALARVTAPEMESEEDLDIEKLYDDRLVIAAGLHSRWAGRDTIDLAELVDEPWIQAPPGTWNHIWVERAFKARGLPMPRPSVVTLSVALRAQLLSSGPYLAAFPSSLIAVNPDRFPLKALPVDLEDEPWPVTILTLRNRTLSPLAEKFIAHLRAFAQASGLRSEPQRPARRR